MQYNNRSVIAHKLVIYLRLFNHVETECVFMTGQRVNIN